MVNIKAEPQGREWFFVADFAKRYGLTIGGANRRLMNMLAAGQVERWKGYVKGSGGCAPKCKYRVRAAA